LVDRACLQLHVGLDARASARGPTSTGCSPLTHAIRDRGNGGGRLLQCAYATLLSSLRSLSACVALPRPRPSDAGVARGSGWLARWRPFARTDRARCRTPWSLP